MSPLYVQDTFKLYEADVDNLVQFARRNHILSGIGGLCQVTAQGAPNMTVQVAAGSIVYDDVTQAVAAVPSLNIGANGTGNPRVDLVSVTKAGVVSVTAGAAAAVPKPPSLPANSLLLAYVSVAPAAANIQNSNITDRRLDDAPVSASVLVSRYLVNDAVNATKAGAGYADFGGNYTATVTTLAGDKVCVRVNALLRKLVGGQANIIIDRGGTKLPEAGGGPASSNVLGSVVPAMLEVWDTPGAGTFTYKAQVYTDDANTAGAGLGARAQMVVEVWRG